VTAVAVAGGGLPFASCLNAFLSSNRLGPHRSHEPIRRDRRYHRL